MYFGQTFLDFSFIVPDVHVIILLFCLFVCDLSWPSDPLALTSWATEVAGALAITAASVRLRAD